MDCNMPEMDGFDATAAIRAMEGEHKHTIIVAMTANALHGDRERVLAAGMDDYLAKPVSQKELATLIREWALKARRNGGGAHQAAAAIEIPAHARIGEIIDDERLGQLQELGDGQNAEWLRNLVETYVRDAEQRITEMREAARAENPAAVGQLAHALKGSSKNLGVRNVIPICQRLQSLDESCTCAGMYGLLQELEEEFARTREALQRWFDVPFHGSSTSAGVQ
jgi:CheY-like chemotaxis protein